MSNKTKDTIPFNSAVEIGLRTLVLLSEGYPQTYSVQQLVVFDYLLVHSDDIPGGPIGLHPQTPYRSGELMIRRGVIQEGLLLYQSRGLIEKCYRDSGVLYMATDRSAGFLDVLDAEYVAALRDRALWLLETFGLSSEQELTQLADRNLGKWGAEFGMESVLWEEEI